MRILHVNNQASVGYLLSRSQRKLGHTSDLLAQKNRFQREPDHVGEGVKGVFLKILKLAPKYDIIHVHGGIGISGIGMAPLKALKKRFFAHYHGSELRQNIQTSFHSLAERIFISTPDLMRYSSNLGERDLIHIPNPVFTDNVTPVDWDTRIQHLEGDDDLLIAHLPSVREVKGTDNVIRSVDEAKKDGARIELDIIEDVTVDDAMKRLEKADICIDWMSTKYDIHGVVSVESMLRSIPTICNIDRSLYPENIPLIDVGPENLSMKLMELDRRRKELPELGSVSREYALEMHEPMKVARMLEKYIN
jgi:glycosyltransferase involved in cell wall biosynthesis